MWGVDGNKTCGISDTIYVTDNGVASFFNLDKDFVVHPSQTKHVEPVEAGSVQHLKAVTSKRQSRKSTR